MLFFKGKEDMGLEASLKLLDLSPDATIDDANQAYAYLHRMIERFHQDGGETDRGNRQEDMDLLTGAYEKTVAYISDRVPQPVTATVDTFQSPVVTAPDATDLHFTINFCDDADKIPSQDNDSRLPEANDQTVDDAIAITAKRLQQTQAALPGAKEAVDSARTAATVASLRFERAKKARMDALITAKLAKSRALLLEIEAKRAMDDAIVVAQKARDRVAAARQAASQARVEADKARQQTGRMGGSEQMAAAEVVCAEDRLEAAKVQLKTLTHTLLQTRHRIKLIQGDRKEHPAPADDPVAMPPDRLPSCPSVDTQADERQQILSDLLEIEASLKCRNPIPSAAKSPDIAKPDTAGAEGERRRHDRLAYPPGQGPAFCIDGRAIPVLDLSACGIRLETNDGMIGQRIVRGTIAFGSRQPVKVTGKVIRQDDHGMGLKLVTRIGSRILDQERLRLSA